MLQNAPLIVKIGVDTEENEPRKEWCVVAILNHADIFIVERPLGEGWSVLCSQNSLNWKKKEKRHLVELLKFH